jgi:hypothetical protein
MADRSLLPDKARLEKLLKELLGPDEEMDEASASSILEQHGITDQELVNELRARLEREVRERESQGLVIPPMLLEALGGLPKTEEEDIAVDPDTWIRKMLEGGLPGGDAGLNHASHLHSFRGLNMESLSEEDRQILERLAEELKSGSDEGES